MKNNSEIMRSIFNIFSCSGVLYFDSHCIVTSAFVYACFILFSFSFTNLLLIIYLFHRVHLQHQCQHPSGQVWSQQLMFFSLEFKR